MKYTAWRLKAGKISNLSLEEVSSPKLGSQDVRIEVRAIGLNFADVFAIWGLYSATPEGRFTPGLEYAGIVAETGSEVNSVKPGDRVMGVTRFGAYASQVVIDHRYVIPLPESWGFSQGASYLVQSLTAYYGLKTLGDIQVGQNILIHSAAGGVGVWANRIAKKYDAFTVGSVGNASKIDFCKQEGYDAVIVRAKDFAQRLEAYLGDRPLNLVMECIGGKIMKQSFEAMAPMGRLIVYGSAQYASTHNRPFYPRLIWKYIHRPRMDPQNMTNMNKSVMAFNLIWLFEHADLMHKLLGEMQELDLGRPVVGHKFSFEQLPQAIQLFQSGQTMGKVVIELN